MLKGTKSDEDAYSGFGKKANPTKLLKSLKDSRIEVAIVVGLALDFCVGSTALDAKGHGFETIVVEEATKAVMSSEKEKMLERLQTLQVQYVPMDTVLGEFA